MNDLGRQHQGGRRASAGTPTLVPHAIYCCPCCHAGAIDFAQAGGNILRCTNPECRYSGKYSYPIIGGLPVLVDFEDSVIDHDQLVASAEMGSARKQRRVLGPLLSAMLDPDDSANFMSKKFLVRLTSQSHRPRLLVVGGGTMGGGMQPIYQSDAIDVIGFDIYPSPLIQLIADAHSLPFVTGSFDAVWVQAVLEHVLDPKRVVDECHRVLRPRGLIYAGTPFMQQVHEGAYDFQRFTESGHRWLFRNFERLDSGVDGGPGMSLQWAFRYFIAGLFRSNKAGRLAELSIFWLRFLDKIMPSTWLIDGACGVWFYGVRSDDTLRPSDIIAQYRGAQK